MMKTERKGKRNNFIESGSIDYGPSRKDLNHNHGGFDLNHELEVAEVNEEPKASPFYRSSVFHLDDKNEGDNTDDARFYSTSGKPFRYKHRCGELASTGIYGPSKKDLNHNPWDKGLNPEAKVSLRYRSSVFHLDDKDEGDNTEDANSYSKSLFDLNYKFDGLRIR